MSDLDLQIPDIDDRVVRENIRKINEYLKNIPLLKGLFEFYEINIPKTAIAYQVKHGLKFKPRDIILTSQIGIGAVTFLYEKFTPDSIFITTTGPVIVRCFIGTYDKGRK